MYSAERRRDILRLIQENSSVSVDDLAARFAVSPSSIRRDLNELSRHGLVQRTYGGAMGHATRSSETPYSERAIAHRAEKERIGQQAASLIVPGDTLFIDGGTTTELMLDYLPTRERITVVTFGLNIVQRLVGRDNITVILVGGILHSSTLTFGGVFANDSFDCFNLRFDKAFLAASGVSAEAGITNAGFEDIPIKRKAIRSAQRKILLADSSKVGLIAPGVIAPASELHQLITDQSAPFSEIERIQQIGVAVTLV
jgi:DeoR family transcriptional regulator, fructose operon transcriptional repressor